MKDRDADVVAVLGNLEILAVLAGAQPAVPASSAHYYQVFEGLAKREESCHLSPCTLRQGCQTLLKISSHTR